MTALELEEFESLENLQALFRDPEAQERLSHLGVRTALVATWDGLLVDSVVNDDEPVALDTLAANAAAALQLSHEEPSSGHADGVLAEFDAGSTVIVDPVGNNSLVAFVIKPASDVDQLRTELRTLVKRQSAGGVTPPSAPDGRGASVAAPAKTSHTVSRSPETSAPVPRPEVRAPAARPVPSAPAMPRVPAAPTQAPRPVPQRAEPKPQPLRATRPAVSTVKEIIRSTPAGRRVILKGVSLEAAGFSATVTVELLLNGETVVGKAVMRNDSTQYVAVAAEAAIQAVTQLLPDGYGVVLEQIAVLASDVEQDIRAVSVKVLFLSPDGEQTLLGIAKITGDEPMAGAKTVLSAVNSSLEAIFAQQEDYVR